MTEPRTAGRHETPGQPPLRMSRSSGALIRAAIIVGGLVAGLAVAGWHWIVNTALLGSRLPTAMYVLLVGVFLAVALAVAVVAFWQGRRGIARRSQARRRQWRDGWL